MKRGHNLKNIHSRVMGLVGNDVEFDVEYSPVAMTRNAMTRFTGLTRHGTSVPSIFLINLM